MRLIPPAFDVHVGLHKGVEKFSIERRTLSGRTFRSSLPQKYFEGYDIDSIELPEKVPGDRDDIPNNAGNRRTPEQLQIDVVQQKKLTRGYYASVSYLDAMAGSVLKALDDSGERDNTIVIFTSDHGYHLGEYDIQSKVSPHEVSARVPLIIQCA